MPGIGVADVLHRAIERLERAVEHRRLRDPRAQVTARVHDEQWRPDAADVRKRTVAVDDRAVPRVVGIPAHRPFDETPGIALPEERRQVVDAALGDRGLEPVIVRHDPRREVPGVAAAGHHEAVLVDPLFKGDLIDHGQDVAGGPVAPILVVAPLKAVAVPAGAARIAVRHAVAPTAQQLKLVPHGQFARSPHRRGPAMDLQDQGVPGPGPAVRRLHDPVLHARAVGPDDPSFGRQRKALPGDPGVQVEHHPIAAGIAHPEHARVGRTRHRVHDRGTAGVERAYADDLILMPLDDHCRFQQSGANGEQGKTAAESRREDDRRLVGHPLKVADGRIERLCRREHDRLAAVDPLGGSEGEPSLPERRLVEPAGREGQQGSVTVGRRVLQRPAVEPQ